MVPITKDVSVPFDYHRFIIGKKGDGIRQLMQTHDVNIAIPPAEQQSDTVTVVGTAACVEKAVEALMEKVRELDQEQEDKVKRLPAYPVLFPDWSRKKGSWLLFGLRLEGFVRIVFECRGEEEVL